MQRRAFIAGFGYLAALGPRLGNAVVRDPLPPEGVELDYKVLFGDSQIGLQKMRIRSHDLAGHVVIDHESRMQVRVLFAVAYSLEHRSTEVWDGFDLKSIRSDTIENGERTLVVGEATEKGFVIRKGEQDWLVPSGVVTSDSFWIATAMNACNVVNARTGDFARPEVRDLGGGRWHIKGAFDHGPVEATLRFAGNFLAEAEVDSDGHRVRLLRVQA